MSQANIPNITPIISITAGQSVALMLSSIALEELALAHIINAEAEKIQYVVGTLEGGGPCPVNVSIDDLINVNCLVSRTLQSAIKQQILLQFKLENIVDLINILPCPPPPPPPPPPVPVCCS
ncbi:hypothetical protein [Pasteuria penetrans]|uniref:hypothetical protein n=1 Tax=Pasteuria penetrans TaxID=86005 RepID=UPI000F94DD47|nr:hypothetical protein [Pasteuria penetrans]